MAMFFALCESETEKMLPFPEGPFRTFRAAKKYAEGSGPRPCVVLQLRWKNHAAAESGRWD